MDVRPIDIETVKSFFLSDVRLCLSSLPDNFNRALFLENKVLLHANDQTHGVYDNNELIGIGIWSLFTDVTAQVHFYIKSKYRLTRKWIKLFRALEQFWKKQSGIKRIIGMIPDECVYAQKVVLHLGFTKEGQIKNSIIWKERLQDVLIYGYDL